MVKNECVLNMRFKIAVKTKQTNTIMIIHIIPNASPERNIPPGTFVNLKSKVVKSPTDKMPVNMVAVRLVIIAANGSRLCEVADFQHKTSIEKLNLKLALNCHRCTEPAILQNRCYQLAFLFTVPVNHCRF